MQQLGWPAESAADCQCAHLATAGCTRHPKLHACKVVDEADRGPAGGAAICPCQEAPCTVLPRRKPISVTLARGTLELHCICHLLHADAAARSKPDPGRLPTYDPEDMVYEPDTEQIPAYEPPRQVSSASSMPLHKSGHTQMPPLFCGSQAIQETPAVFSVVKHRLS